MQRFLEGLDSTSSEWWVPPVPVVDQIQSVTYESTFWNENCPLVVHSQGDDIRQVAIASESCHESIMPTAVVKVFDECENVLKLEARQYRCHYQTPFLSNDVMAIHAKWKTWPNQACQRP